MVGKMRPGRVGHDVWREDDEWPASWIDMSVPTVTLLHPSSVVPSSSFYKLCFYGSEFWKFGLWNIFFQKTLKTFWKLWIDSLIDELNLEFWKRGTTANLQTLQLLLGYEDWRLIFAVFLQRFADAKIRFHISPFPYIRITLINWLTPCRSPNKKWICNISRQNRKVTSWAEGFFGGISHILAKSEQKLGRA